MDIFFRLRKRDTLHALKLCGKIGLELGKIDARRVLNGFRKVGLNGCYDVGW